MGIEGKAHQEFMPSTHPQKSQKIVTLNDLPFESNASCFPNRYSLVAISTPAPNVLLEMYLLKFLHQDLYPWSVLPGRAKSWFGKSRGLIQEGT